MASFGRLSRRLVCTAAAAAAVLVLVAGGANAAARVEPRVQEQAKIEIVVDKAKQQMIVYVGGQKRHEWKVSTGTVGHDTPAGTFKPMSMHPMAYAPKYGNTPMPHTIFFTKAGHGIHATTAVRQLGRRASHGCIRLSPENAKALYQLVKEIGLENTTIRIV